MEFQTQRIAGFELRTASHATNKPMVLLTNAFPQSIRCWESLWERLAERFDLLAVDMPGFGRSSGGASVMSPSEQANVLIELMDANEIERAFVVGPDVGAPVALWMASLHPDRVYGVNVFDGPGCWPTDFDPALRSATQSRFIRWVGTLPLVRRALMAQNFKVASGLGYHHFKPSDAAIDEYRQVCFDPEKHRNALAYLGSYQNDLPALQERLSSLKVPALITWGAHDPFVLPSNAERLHALLPDSELTVFDNAAHFSHEDADERWLERFTRFAEVLLTKRDMAAV